MHRHRVNNELEEWFNVRKWSRQRDPVLPYVFITHLERVMDANKDLKGDSAVHGVSINNLRFVDDMDLIEASSSSLQEAAQLLNERARKAIGPSHKQSIDTVFGNDDIGQPVKINDYTLENVPQSHISAVTYDNDCSQHVWTRIGKATEVTKSVENI